MKKNAVLVLLVAIIAVGIAISSLFMDDSSESEELNENKPETDQVATVDPAEFQQLLNHEPGTIVDVRTQEEYDEGHLAETDHHLNLLNGDFEAALSSLDKDETYYLYCRSGNRSGQAAELMTENGFENIYNIGGFQDLVDAGAKVRNKIGKVYQGLCKIKMSPCPPAGPGNLSEAFSIVIFVTKTNQKVLGES